MGTQEKILPAHLFAPGQRYIAILDHVLDLALHCHKEKDTEVEEEDWPEDGDIKDAKEGEHNADQERLEGSIPATEVWKVSPPFEKFMHRKSKQHRCACECVHGRALRTTESQGRKSAREDFLPTGKSLFTNWNAYDFSCADASCGCNLMDGDLCRKFPVVNAMHHRLWCIASTTGNIT